MKFLVILTIVLVPFLGHTQINISAGFSSGLMAGIETTQDYINSGVYLSGGLNLEDFEINIKYRQLFIGSSQFNETVYAQNSNISPYTLNGIYDVSHTIDDFSITGTNYLFEGDRFSFHGFIGFGLMNSIQTVNPNFNENSYINPYRLGNLRSETRVYTSSGIKTSLNINDGLSIDLTGELYFMDSILGVVYLGFRNHFFLTASLGITKKLKL